jgi:hypothetical protein
MRPAPGPGVRSVTGRGVDAGAALRTRAAQLDGRSSIACATPEMRRDGSTIAMGTDGTCAVPQGEEFYGALRGTGYVVGLLLQ